MEWLREGGFGGVMIWSVDMDDFRGSCGMGKFPLISAINTGLEGYRVKNTFEGPYDGVSVYQKKKKNREHNSFQFLPPIVSYCSASYICVRSTDYI